MDSGKERTKRWTKKEQRNKGALEYAKEKSGYWKALKDEKESGAISFKAIMTSSVIVTEAVARFCHASQREILQLSTKLL